jgi:HEAT repeat protein
MAAFLGASELKPHGDGVTAPGPRVGVIDTIRTKRFSCGKLGKTCRESSLARRRERCAQENLIGVPYDRGRVAVSGLETTFAHLTRTGNESAVELLITALDSPEREVQALAVRAILQRNNIVGKRELVRRWRQLPERFRAMIAERPGRVSGAARDSILGADVQLRDCGCEVALGTRDHDLIPVLVSAVEDKNNSQAEKAAQTLLALCEMLQEDLSVSRTTSKARDSRAVLTTITPAVEASVRRFEHHHRGDILEAFLLLATPENRLLRAILEDPHHRAYLSCISLLSQSPRPAVMNLVLSYLHDPQAPSAIHHVLARRRDIPFLRLLLRQVGSDMSPEVRANLRRVKSISWLRGEQASLQALNDEEQTNVVHLTMASGLDRLHSFAVLRHLLLHGQLNCRRAAVDALSEFRGAEANSLVMQLIQDEDPVTRARAVAQLRERGIPGALTTLIVLLDTSEPLVQEAASKSLSEFQFRRFYDAFDHMDEATRRNAGSLVRRVDDRAIELLARELRAPTRVRRLRAIEMAVAMDATAQVESVLIELLSGDDQRVRTEVLHALASQGSPQSKEALRERLADESAIIAQAAEAALRAMAEMELTRGPVPVAPSAIAGKIGQGPPCSEVVA